MGGYTFGQNGRATQLARPGLGAGKRAPLICIMALMPIRLAQLAQHLVGGGLRDEAQQRPECSHWHAAAIEPKHEFIVSATICRSCLISTSRRAAILPKPSRCSPAWRGSS